MYMGIRASSMQSAWGRCRRGGYHNQKHVSMIDPRLEGAEDMESDAVSSLFRPVKGFSLFVVWWLEHCSGGDDDELPLLNSLRRSLLPELSNLSEPCAWRAPGECRSCSLPALRPCQTLEHWLSPASSAAGCRDGRLVYC